jgi:hypothetical protein
MPHVVAPFTVTARPPEEGLGTEPPVVGPTVLDKTFAGGALSGSSVVRMVSAAGADGPLAYVALERVEGELDGRAGAFVLRHVGTITASGPSLDLVVVGGSATGGLVGLTGTGTIVHGEDGPRLELDYALPR